MTMKEPAKPDAAVSCEPLSGRPWLTGRVVWLLPALAALAFHLPALFCDFVYDDTTLVERHPLLGQASFARQIFQRDYGLEFSPGPRGYYRPLFMLLNFALRHLAGASPAAYHLFSLLMFCGAAVLVARVAAAILPAGSRPAAVLAGCLYAAHPARVETVSLFMSLPDLLVEIGALLLALAACRLPSERQGRTTSWPWVPALAALGLAAGLTKESAFFLLPALCLTLAADAALRGSSAGWKPYAMGCAVLAGLALALLLRKFAHIQPPEGTGEGMAAAVASRSGPVLYDVSRALREIVIPGPAVFRREVNMASTSLTGAALVLYLVTFAGFWGGFLLRRRLPQALLAAWFGAGMVNLMVLTGTGLPYSQRYVPAAPAIIGLTALLAQLAGRVPTRYGSVRRLAPWLAAAYVCAYGAFALAGSATCLTRRSFYTALAEADPQAFIPAGAMAEVAYESGPVEEVIAHVRRAASLDPSHPQLPLLYNLPAKRFLREQRYAEAAAWLDEALERYPADGDKWALRSVTHAYIGELDRATNAIWKALSLVPDHPAYVTLLRQISQAGTNNAPQR